MWLGTDIKYTSESSDFELQVNGEADLFIGVPSIKSVSFRCSFPFQFDHNKYYFIWTLFVFLLKKTETLFDL
jgi:hypothetical protein